MKIPAAVLLTCVVAFPGRVLALSGQSEARAESAGRIRLNLVDGMPVVDGVYLDGHGPYRFLLDTGTQSNQLDSALARQLGFTVTLEVTLRTPSGPSLVHGGRVQAVTLGAMQANDQEFLFTPIDGLHRHVPDARGILGQAFLAHFDYLLDLRHRHLIVDDPPMTGLKVYTRLIFGRMAVPTSQGDLVLDSGIRTLFLFRSGSPGLASIEVSSASGQRAAITRGAAPPLRIGDRQFHPDGTVFRPVPEAEEVGLLPASLFHVLFISNSQQYILIDPQISNLTRTSY